MCQDTPDLADEYNCEVQPGDIVVCATDGVFDNLFNHEVLEIIKKYKDERYNQKKYAFDG